MREAKSGMQPRACVFCASADGAGGQYRAAAAELGRRLAEAGWGLVYGGAHVGLMGAAADAAIAAGGETIGVIPRALEEKEVAHRHLSRLYVVETMHERKQKMVDLADAFVALPGGFGTLDEFFEVLTWAQLGIHDKPCVLVNLEGYFAELLAFLETAVREGFLKGENRDLIRTVARVEDLVPLLQGLWERAPENREGRNRERQKRERAGPAAVVPKP